MENTAIDRSPPPPAEAPSGRLAMLLPAERILLNVDCQSKKRVFERVCILLENVGGLPRDELFSQLIARERLGSTAVGNFGAIPHARMKDIQEPICAMAQLANPIQYDAQDADNGLVRVLLFLIAPEKANSAHLRLLAVFAAMLTDNELMGALAACEDANAAHREIARWEAARADMVSAVFDEKT